MSIFTQGKTLDELMSNLKEAVSVHFEDELKESEEISILVISEVKVPPLLLQSEKLAD